MAGHRLLYKKQMRFACRIAKATETHLEYVTHITFPRQQWLRKRASMLEISALPVLFYKAFLRL
jgi:hypothetical protein